MTEEYLSIAGPVEAEIEDRRSRFLAHLEPVPDEASARSVIEAVRRQHHTARHHCLAFVLGPDGAVERSSDDGEPAGTAGAPMLEVLRGRQLRDVVAVVTAPAFLQEQRALRREGMSVEKLKGVRARQMSDHHKRRLADAVIPSGLGKRETLRRLKQVLKVAQTRTGF